MQFVNKKTIPVQTLAAASAGVTGGDVSNPDSAGLHVVVDITALTGTGPTLTVVIEGKDEVSGKYYTLLSSAALAAVATTVLRVYPGYPVTANLSNNDSLPRTWRIRTTIAGTTPAVTATISANLLL